MGYTTFFAWISTDWDWRTNVIYRAFVPKDTSNIVVVVLQSKCFNHILVALKANHFPAFPAQV
jgi:hypothetical protein